MTEHRLFSGISPVLILCAGFGVLTAAWLGFLVVDILDLFGLGTGLYDMMHERSPSRAWLWVILFTESAPIEMMQWLLLVTAAGLAFHIHGRLTAMKNADRKNFHARTFWLLMGIAFLLMLIEDAGNARHWFRAFIGGVFGGRSGAVTELACFAALAAAPLSALVLFSRPVLQIPKTRNLILGGYFFYALAAGGSAVRYHWYEAAGDWLHVHIFGEALKTVEVGSHGHGFWIMDYLVEESLELAGATLLAATAATFLREYHAFTKTHEMSET